MSDLVTLNLQLQPGSGAASVAVDAADQRGGATVQSAPPPASTRSRSPARTLAALTRNGALSQPEPCTSAGCSQSLQIQTVPNDPDYTNGSQWQSTAPGASMLPRPGTSPPARIR